MRVWILSDFSCLGEGGRRALPNEGSARMCVVLMEHVICATSQRLLAGDGRRMITLFPPIHLPFFPSRVIVNNNIKRCLERVPLGWRNELIKRLVHWTRILVDINRGESLVFSGSNEAFPNLGHGSKNSEGTPKGHQLQPLGNAGYPQGMHSW